MPTSMCHEFFGDLRIIITRCWTISIYDHYAMAKCLRLVTVLTQVQTSHRLQLEFKILQGSLRIKLDFFSVTTDL